MTDLGLLKFFLGLEVKQGETCSFISQEKYAKEILKKYKMENCNPVSTSMEPDVRNVVGRREKIVENRI